MKKILCICMMILCNFILLSNISNAANDIPIFDPTFDSNNGAFFSNGNNITIDKDESNNTVISWDGGSQVVPSTVTVFGGGKGTSLYNNSEIIMNDGIVMDIIAGGVSTQSNEIARVNNSNIVINGGTVYGNVSGGGYLYSEVENSNITINNGVIGTIEGGGFATVVIDGVAYNVGTEENPELSENRTENVNIVINNGKIDSENMGVGLVFGGGQGYSYVGKSNITINNGDLSNAYVTAGGSNGYTGQSNVEINDGNIKVYQSVNRGIVEDASLQVNGGNIENVYVGGETEDATVTGTINNSNVYLINGEIGKLNAGKSNSEEIIIDNSNYSVAKTDEVRITEDTLRTRPIIIDYDIKINPSSIEINKDETAKLNAEVTTNPKGFEFLFNKITWNSSDDSIVSVTQNGEIEGIKEGNATITASVNKKTATAEVIVKNNSTGLVLLGIVLALVFIVILFIIILG